MQRYGIAKDEIRPLDAFESFIYEFERRGEVQIKDQSGKLALTVRLLLTVSKGRIRNLCILVGARREI